MKKINFAIIGCGRISYKHVEALIFNIEKSKLVALCDINIEKANIRKEQYEKSTDISVKVYEDYKIMLKKEEIDVVVISTESGNHFQHAMDALKINKHVLIEKPITMNSVEADQLLEEAENRNLIIGVCHQNRFNDAIQKLRNAVDINKFGKISNITARILWNRNDDYYNQATWRGTKKMDGGTLMNQCIHNIDLLQWMANSPVERIYAERDTYFRNIEMEDFGAILIRFKNGIIGIVEGSAIVFPNNLEETLSIFGEKGTVVIGGMAVNEIKEWRFKDESIEDIENSSDEIDSVYGTGHKLLYKDYIDALENDRQPLINGYEGKKAMEIINKAYSVSRLNEFEKN
jgi:predicted dehydrogenase